MKLTGHDPILPQTVVREIRERYPQVVNDTLLEAVAHYYAVAPGRGLRWTVALLQSIHETDWMRSPVCQMKLNYAGIKFQGGHPSAGRYRTYVSPEGGIRDHVDLLAVYTGLWVPRMVDPTRNDRFPGMLEEKLGRPYARTLTDLNGIWAVPGDQYGQNIERTWWSLLG